MSNFWTGERVARVPRYVFAGILGLTIVVFALVASAVGFETAWEILTASKSPFGKDRGLEVALSLLGYVFVPTAIGLAVADWITRFQRRRLISVTEARTIIGELVDRAKDPGVEETSEAKLAGEAGE